MGLFFSIIVPVYNVAPYLRKCVGSLLAQPMGDYEIILVDDGSTDQSPGLCDMFAEKSGRVTAIHKQNGGLSDARNAGLAAATGEYVLFVDGDDYIAGGSLAHVRSTIVKDGYPDVVFLGCVKAYGAGRYLPMADGVGAGICGLGQKEIWGYLAALPKFPAGAWAKAVRRSMFAGGGLYFKKGLLCEDLEWSQRLFFKMASAGYCPGAYYFYRQGRRGSISSTRSEKKAMDILSTVEGWGACAREAKDPQARLLLCSLMEYVFRHLLTGYSGVRGPGRGPYRRRVRETAWTLHTRKDTASRCIACSYRLLGTCMAGKLLELYLSVREHSCRRGVKRKVRKRKVRKRYRWGCIPMGKGHVCQRKAKRKGLQMMPGDACLLGSGHIYRKGTKREGCK